MNDHVDQYAVFGFPIGHSLSPFIHQAFAKQTGQSISYKAIEVKPADFDQTVDDFFESGGKGINCTVPLKEMAFDKVDVLSDRAEFSGAVNTVKLMDDGTLFGDNTDGAGLLKDLTDHLQLNLAGKRMLVLGAGGAARGILGPLLESKPGSLWLANRTLSKAELLQELFKPLGAIDVGSYSDLSGKIFDLIINATSASLSGDLPPLPSHLLSESTVCYDLAYSKKPTAFMEWALRDGAKFAIDGSGMLVEQAAQAFYLWRGVLPETKNVLKELKGL
ncbi:MAG: shikimate dehydrogenase [Piscirickettsiaceae bacterium]|nr:MAG: shikimate dehydrogenase [Piscirickettsiaceae bacterium]PCI69938.1 MAG: shikimate dehydrogenase [Piscirickettsiaceae bacterium]